MSEVKKPYSIDQVVKKCAGNEKTVRRWAQSGRLKTIAGSGGQGRALAFERSVIDSISKDRRNARDTSLA